MFREALGYPTRAPLGGRAVLIGGTLLFVAAALVGVAVVGTLEPLAGEVPLEATLAPVALVATLPMLLVRGYYVRVVRTTLGRDFPTPPPFGNVSRLLVDGLGATLVAVGYLLPGALVLAPFVYARTRDTDVVSLTLGEGVSAAVRDGLLAGAGMVALFAVAAVVAAVYAIPVAVAVFAHDGRLRAGFDVGTVASGALSEDYAVTWVVTVLLQVLFLPVAFALNAILVGFYLQFIVGVAVRYCYGQGVGAALDLPPVTADQRPIVGREGERT